MGHGVFPPLGCHILEVQGEVLLGLLCAHRELDINPSLPALALVEPDFESNIWGNQLGDI